MTEQQKPEEYQKKYIQHFFAGRKAVLNSKKEDILIEECHFETKIFIKNDFENFGIFNLKANKDITCSIFYAIYSLIDSSVDHNSNLFQDLKNIVSCDNILELIVYRYKKEIYLNNYKINFSSLESESDAEGIWLHNGARIAILLAICGCSVNFKDIRDEGDDAYLYHMNEYGTIKIEQKEDTLGSAK